MNIIGFNTGHDGHICYLQGNTLAFSYEAEKDNNPRYSDNTPLNIKTGLLATSNRIDAVAVSGWAKGHDPRNMPVHGGYLGLDYSIHHQGQTPWIHCSHEMSHIVCSYALSPYADKTDCYVLLLEGFIGKLYLIRKDLSVELLEEIMQSPGLRYSFAFGIADPLFNLPKGYCRLGDAGKMMALAAFGRSGELTSDEREIINYLLNTESPIDSFSKDEFKTSSYFNIGVQHQKFCDLAKKISDSLFHTISRKITPHIQERKPLLIAGGCGLNCDWNKKWLDSGVFDDVFIPPCTNDTGVAIGAAALAKKLLQGSSLIHWSVYSGQPFRVEHNSNNSPNFKTEPLSLEVICQKLLDNEIVCWVQGNCEIGPRALGNRSILAAPFSKSTTTRLNTIKKRESYRPIAPICLEEDAAFYFKGCRQSKFMLNFHHVIDPNLPAVTHVDGTARVQTISYQDNSAIYDLLKTFKAISGYGVLCNTSLNFQGAGFINNRGDLEAFCLENGITTFVINDLMYTKK